MEWSATQSCARRSLNVVNAFGWSIVSRALPLGSPQTTTSASTRGYKMSDAATSMSPGLPKLAEALAKAQLVMGAAAKDKTNPHFNSKYADLASVMDACREPLAQNGLAVLQLLVNDDKGVAVTTRLMHASGESVESTCWLPVVQKTPQGYGSAISYARRYSLSALVGVTAEDDDGNAASGAGKTPPPAGVDKLTKAANGEADPVMKNGPANGKKLSQLTDDEVSYYLATCKATLADAKQAHFHDAAKTRKAVIETELARRGLPA